MGKRKAVASSSDEEDDSPLRMAASSPDRPLQTARRSGKKAKSKAHSDGESEEEEEKPIKKSKAKDKAKAAKPPSIKKPKIPTLDEDDADDVKTGVTTEGERFVDLGKKKRATVRMFKGSKYLDIREFYGDEDDLKPGKKGISINQEQWESLKKSSDVIDSFFARLKS
ncbi:transcriptional Coactivator p15-domain-containing protein [Ganoderma leucocontextum]|nr:transcriptional Coactivator p15-domain-containing protein [Ganoderma leucocontextum]